MRLQRCEGGSVTPGQYLPPSGESHPTQGVTTVCSVSVSTIYLLITQIFSVSKILSLTRTSVVTLNLM